MRCATLKVVASFYIVSLFTFECLAKAALKHPGAANSANTTKHALLFQPTAAQVLLYIPFHVSEPSQNLHEFLDCTFRHRPTLHGLQFDVLLSISGLQPDGREERLHGMLRRHLATVAPTAQVYVQFTELTIDDYDVLYVKESANRLAGPNDAFYDAFLDGAVYNKYVLRYAFVQQLESDTCSLRDGWLDALLHPALSNDDIIVSGATVKGNCLYDAKYDICQPLVGVPAFMTGHVNGNALYRVGEGLTALLTLARTFGNAEPFDTAMYKAAEMLGKEHALYSNPSIYNMASLVDSNWFRDAAYYGSSSPVAVVHVPRRLRTNSVQAVASRFHKNVPLTLVSLGLNDIGAAKNLSQALHNQSVNMAFVATDEATYVRAVDVWPYRVIPAFPKTRNSAEWPRSRLSSGLVLTAVSRLNKMRYSVFVLPPKSIVDANFGGRLRSLSSTYVHVSSSPFIDKRKKRNDCSVGPAYFPRLVANPLVNIWADQLVKGTCMSNNRFTAMAASAGIGDHVVELNDVYVSDSWSIPRHTRPQATNVFVACIVLAFGCFCVVSVLAIVAESQKMYVTHVHFWPRKASNLRRTLLRRV